MISPEKLDFWIQNNLNVLMIGEKGVGKTHLTIDAFKRNKLRFKYFSGPTLDPFVDLLGVPREKKTEDGKSFLDFIQPRELANDEVDCIFIDEISRAHYKVKNAVLELIQFKSINGRKFNNLRFIWAAMNPPDSNRRYQVEELDDAQWDRFQVHVRLDYKPDVKFFIGKFQEKGKAAIEWWNGIPEAQKYLVSPRRLEYALEYNQIGGDLRDILPKEVNVTELSKVLGTGPIIDRLKNIVNSNNKDEGMKLVNDSNLYSVAEKYIISDEKYINFFLPLLTEEKLVTLYSLNNSKIGTFFATQISNEKDAGKSDSGKYTGIMRDIIKANGNPGLVTKAKKGLDAYGVSHVKKPENLNEKMQKAQELAGKLSKSNEVIKKQVYEDLKELYLFAYHSSDQHNAETMLANLLKLGKNVSDDEILKNYRDLPQICIELRNLIKKPASLYKEFGFTSETLRASMERMEKVEKEILPF